ncbi:hypothetical protein ES703_74542 [subsurface metagenome]
MKRGGPVQSFINAIKFLARGGSTDTVPIWATPGEYLIKKEMVDFIKRTGMVTGGLVEAIRKGLPTPSPQFAGEGMVGRWGISQGYPGAVSGKSGKWVYSPTIQINNPIISDLIDLDDVIAVVRKTLDESADAFDFSGFEVEV